MKTDKNKNNNKDVITELFDSFFEEVFNVIASLFNQIGKIILSGFDNTLEWHPNNQDLSKKLDNPKNTLNATSLGFNLSHKKEFLFSDYNSNVPLSVIIGPPGWGKTVLMLNLLDRDLSLDIPYIVFDPKASQKSKETFISLSRLHGKKPLIFDLGSDLRLNPLKGLDPTQIVESIYRAFPNKHEYYGPRSKDILIDVIRILRTQGEIISFRTIYKSLEDLAQRDRNIQIETQAIKSNIKLLLNSEFGRLFEDRGDALSITDIREKGHCLYVSLPALAYNELAQAIAKIFISEIMNHSFKAMNKDHNYKNLSVYIDEAGDFLFEDFKSLPAQCREAGVNLTIATQTISDLQAVSVNFLNQIKTYAGNFWIFKVPDPENAEKMARYLGTKTTVKETKQVMDGAESGRGSEREKESFIVHTNILKNLPKYKALLKRGDQKEPILINIRNIEKVYSLDAPIKEQSIKPKPSKEDFLDLFLN